MSADGSSVVVAGRGSDGNGHQTWIVRRYSGAGLATVTNLENSASPIPGGTTTYLESVAMSADGTSIVATGGVNDGAIKWVVKRYSGVNFSTVDIIENSTGIDGETWGHGRSVSMSADGSSFVVGGQTQSVANHYKWIVKRYSGANFATVQVLENSFGVPGGSNVWIPSVSLSADGSSAFAAGQANVGSDTHWVVKHYGGTGLATVTTLEDSLLDSESSAYADSISSSHDGSWYAACGGTSYNDGTSGWVVKTGQAP